MTRLTLLLVLALAGCTWAIGHNDIETAQKLCKDAGGVKFLEREDANHISITCMQGPRMTVVQVRADWPAGQP